MAKALPGLVLLAGCSLTTSPPSDAEVRRYTETLPPIGAQVSFVFYTHCGVENARIGGRWWHADPPLYRDGEPGLGPPEGWDDPYQRGTLTLVAKRRAVFEAQGTTVVLRPADPDEPRRICA